MIHTTVKSKKGLEARIYGPWMKVEVNGSIIFIHPSSMVANRVLEGRLQLL